MGIPDSLTCLLRNLYADQKATELDMEQWTGSKLRKEYVKAVYCHPAYFKFFKFYTEYIMRNAGLDESQAGIKISINNLKYADDTTLLAESKKELKNILMKVKEESEKVSLNSMFKKQRSWHLVPSLYGK